MAGRKHVQPIGTEGAPKAMNIRVQNQATMMDRLRDFDPDGSLSQRAKEIFALMPDEGHAAAAIFVDTYVARVGLATALGVEGLATMGEQASLYQREKYTNLGGEIWAEIA